MADRLDPTELAAIRERDAALVTRSLEASVVLCPVCGKKVGAWRKPLIHPKCQDRFEQTTPTSLREAFGLPPLEQSIAQLTQAQRDRILRRLPTKAQR